MNTAQALRISCLGQLSGRAGFLLALLAAPLLAQESAGDPDTTSDTIDVIMYTPPNPGDQLEQPSYPAMQLRDGREGFVEVNFMVDVDGSVMDPVVGSSMGGEAFERSALRALEKSRFEPAIMNGEPVVGASSIRYNFNLSDDGTGGSANDTFVYLYRQFAEAANDGNQPRMEEVLAEMEDRGVVNHYEYAFLNLARYGLALRTGDSWEQQNHLHGALSYANSSDDRVYLPDEAQRDLWRTLFTLQVRNRRFPGALNTLEIMESRGDQEGVEALANVVDAIQKLKTDDSEYFLDLEIPEDGVLWHKLFKRRFFITGGEGSVVDFGFYCDTRYSAIQVERDVDYALPASWGECSARIAGDPGATFQLVQH